VTCGRTLRARRWRLLYFAIAAAIAVVLIVAAAAATENLTGSGAGAASTGTVSLTTNGPATHTCDFTALLPGEPIGPPCTFSVRYTGSISAFLALTVLVSSTPGAGGRALFDGSGSSGLILAISDGRASYAVPAGPGRTGGTCPAGSACWARADDLAAWYSGSSPELTFTAGDTTTFDITPVFPASAGGAYQGASVSVTLAAQAVQAPANPLPPGCTVLTIGQPCLPAGGFSWS